MFDSAYLRMIGRNHAMVIGRGIVDGLIDASKYSYGYTRLTLYTHIYLHYTI